MQYLEETQEQNNHNQATKISSRTEKQNYKQTHISVALALLQHKTEVFVRL